MRYIDEFRNQNRVKKIVRKIKSIAPQQNLNFMEVCGTHTHNFLRFGLDKLLPLQINLVSGPGCPVCVSSQEYIDKAITYSKSKNTILVTFGDMFCVPGSQSTLEKERAAGADIRIIYSSLDAISIAKKNPAKKVLFLAVGFETTAPTIALTLICAKEEKIKNLYFFSALKLIPAAMHYLVCDRDLKLHGFLCPGHVSAIIGYQPYGFIPKKYKIGCCVTGFEPLDILEGIYLLLKQIIEKKPSVANQYIRVVAREGNPRAQNIISQVFRVDDAIWRGLGRIPRSGLKLKDKFSQFDAEKNFPISQPRPRIFDQQQKCRCSDVLKGLISPLVCPLFSRVCTPSNPVGVCMVSLEGACNAYYKYKR
jgi:hydrogenase expression/formation protein HypD